MPFKNEDGSIMIVLNGEIYNFRQLKRGLRNDHVFSSESDTEVVLHLYEEMGVDFLKKLEGMFSLALWDKKNKCLIIARDRLGKKPLLYSISNSEFIFASELKAIIADSSIKKDIDNTALNFFFSLNYIPAPYTIYKNIYKLEPGTYLKIDATGAYKISSYWQIQGAEKSQMSYDNSKQEVKKMIREAVRTRIPDECDFGIHLSGGLDSSLITSLATEITGNRQETFSIGYEDKKQDESLFSHYVSRQLNTKHHEFILKKNSIKDLSSAAASFDEPFADPSLLPTWFLCKESSKYFRVMLNGDGGDELFGGYERYQRQFLRKYPILSILARLHAPFITSKNKVGKLITDMGTTSDYQFYVRRILSSNTNITNKFNIYSHFQKYWHTNIENEERPLLFDISTYLSNDLLVKTDMVGMRFGQEIRSPLLDDILFQYTSTLPLSYKVNLFDSKIILKDIAQSLVPSKIIRRKKQGFIFPFQWLYAIENRSFIKEILFTSQTQLFDYVSKKEVLRLVDNENEFGNPQKLWQLIQLQLWFLKGT